MSAVASILSILLFLAFATSGLQKVRFQPHWRPSQPTTSASRKSPISGSVLWSSSVDSDCWSGFPRRARRSGQSSTRLAALGLGRWRCCSPCTSTFERATSPSSSPLRSCSGCSLPRGARLSRRGLGATGAGACA